MHATRLSRLKEEKPREHAAVRRGDKTVQQVHREERKVKAHAAEIFAKRQGLSEQLITEAHEIKIFSLAKLGGCLEKEKEAGRLVAGTRGQLRGRDASGNTRKATPENRRRLSDYGVSAKESSSAQKLSRMAREKPDAFKAVLRREKTPQEVHRAERRMGQLSRELDKARVPGPGRGKKGSPQKGKGFSGKGAKLAQQGIKQQAASRYETSSRMPRGPKKGEPPRRGALRGFW